jgi:hypothetical protein
MATTVTKRVGSGAISSNVARVGESATGTVHSRRIDLYQFLILEGDESGLLLLDGDQQDLESDALRLEGDEAVSDTIGGTITARIPEAVS